MPGEQMFPEGVLPEDHARRTADRARKLQDEINKLGAGPPAAAWCVPDNCPAVLCGGPHEIWRNPQDGREIIFKTGQEKPWPGFTERVLPAPVPEPGPVLGVIADIMSAGEPPMEPPHGHVTPRPDGAVARCGGPGMCEECAAELAALKQAPQAHLDAAIVSAREHQRIAEAHLEAEPHKAAAHCQAGILELLTAIAEQLRSQSA